MVAYSFRQQFRDPILAGTKFQTIRKPRLGRTRHARPGEVTQLYTGMRTRHCAIIGRAVCTEVRPVFIGVEVECVRLGDAWLTSEAVHAFAKADGFADWPAMRDFWRREHPDTRLFSGVLVGWGVLL